MSSALNKMTVEDFDVKGKRVLVRCDFNVKMENGVITSDKRIVASLPTIQYLIKNGAKVILCSHLGRPKGQVNPEFSMKPVAARLSELLGLKVKMADDVVGPSAHALAASLKDGEVMLLENVRFEPGETKNDPELSKEFASLADLYVMMLSVLRTELILQLPALPHIFQQHADILFRKKLSLSAELWKIRRDRLLQFSAEQRFLIKSA